MIRLLSGDVTGIATGSTIGGPGSGMTGVLGEAVTMIATGRTIGGAGSGMIGLASAVMTIVTHKMAGAAPG